MYDHDYHLRSQLWIEHEREYLLAKLRGLPQIKVFDTETNFILCQIKKKKFSAAELKSRMIKKWDSD